MKTSKVLAMQNSCGGSAVGFAKNLNSEFNLAGFLINEFKFLRIFFVTHCWNFFQHKSTFFSYLKLGKMPAKVYAKFKLLSTVLPVVL